MSTHYYSKVVKIFSKWIKIDYALRVGLAMLTVIVKLMFLLHCTASYSNDKTIFFEVVDYCLMLLLVKNCLQFEVKDLELRYSNCFAQQFLKKKNFTNSSELHTSYTLFIISLLLIYQVRIYDHYICSSYTKSLGACVAMWLQ